MTYSKVLIKAIDWTLFHKEHDILDELEPTKVEICGFLMKDEKDFVVIALEIYPESKMFRSSLAIPKVCIEKMEIIG